MAVASLLLAVLVVALVAAVLSPPSPPFALMLVGVCVCVALLVLTPATVQSSILISLWPC